MRPSRCCHVMYVHVSVSVFDSLHSTHATEEWSADNNATAAAKEARDNDLKVVVDAHRQDIIRIPLESEPVKEELIP